MALPKLCQNMCFYQVHQAAGVYEVGAPVKSIQFSADGLSVLMKEGALPSGDGSDTLSVYDVRSGQNITRRSAKEIYSELGYDIGDARFNHSRNLVYASGEKGGFVVLDYPSLEPLHHIRRANITKCRAIGVDMRGRFVATGGGDALVNIWDTQEWIGLRSIENAESGIVSLALSHDGEWLASVCDSGYIDIVESETGLHEARLNQRFMPKSIAWHPTQTLLAVAGGKQKSESWINLIGA